MIAVVTPVSESLTRPRESQVHESIRLEYERRYGSITSFLDCQLFTGVFEPTQDEIDNPKTVVTSAIVRGRQRLTQEALDAGADYVLYWDDDIVPPFTVNGDSPISLLLDDLEAPDAGIASGVCCMRATPGRAAFATWRNTTCPPMPEWDGSWSWPGRPFAVDFVGLAFCLVHRKVFEKIGPDDWFRWNWMREFPDRKQITQHKGEDIWFCIQARKAGYRILIDPNIRCQHIDRKDGASYPPAQYWKNHNAR